MVEQPNAKRWHPTSTIVVAGGFVIGGFFFFSWLGCAKMSESVRSKSAGLNGGFEHVRSGLPANWLVYSPSTIPTGKYELVFDRTDFKEGEQSMRFLVYECSGKVGWHSPVFAQEVSAKPGDSYLVSFWIKNDGCKYVVQAGGVDAKTAQYETVDSSQKAAKSWRFVEYPITIPKKYDRIRFELSIRSPGSLWIDDVKIAAINDNGGTQ